MANIAVTQKDSIVDQLESREWTSKRRRRMPSTRGAEWDDRACLADAVGLPIRDGALDGQGHDEEGPVVDGPVHSHGGGRVRCNGGHW